jgi:hypothetical protein
MAAIHQPWYGGAPAALPFCYERVTMVQQPHAPQFGPGGPAQSGAAFAARAAWLAGLLSHQTDNLNSVAPSKSIFYTDTNALSLFGGVGSLLAPDPFALVWVVDNTVDDGLNGRSNTSPVGFNWLEATDSFEITLSTPQTAFGFFVMDLGDPIAAFSASLEIDYFSGATLLQTVVVPNTAPDSPSSDEAMWVGYENTGVPFNRISFRITQSAADFADFDYIGFDDFTIGLHPPCTPLPGFQRLVMTKGSQGSASGDGMVQSGPAFAARTAFVAELASSVNANMSHVTAGSTNYTPLAPLTLWGGLGSLASLPAPRNPTGTSYNVNVRAGGSNGRFNTDSELTENYLETIQGFEIALTSPRTAFSCYMTDMGEANSAEVEFRFFLGSTLVKAIHAPTDFIEKPTSNSALLFAYADGGKPFDRIQARVQSFWVNPSLVDAVGFDSLLVGTAPDLTVITPPAVFHGANTASDAATTVTGPALTARNSWLAAAGGTAAVANFESMATGIVGDLSGGVVALPFAGGALSGATLSSVWYTGNTGATNYLPRTDIQVNQNTEIKDVNSANRWNTTASGSKYLEWCEEITIALPAAVTSIGFYLTNIGNQNCTVRVMLLRTLPTDSSKRWGGPCYYVPKGAELTSPAGLLRFWGVVGELPFDRIVLQTIFYDSLTLEKQILPPSFGGVPYARIGIDDIMVA